MLHVYPKGLKDESALLKHELAYCLGQIKRTSALPALEATLSDESENPMVRHEVSVFPERGSCYTHLISCQGC